LKKRTKFKKEFRVCLIAFLFITALTWARPGKPEAYIMPAEQLIGLMAANFSKFKTLVITQSTHMFIPQNQGKETILEEKIWLKTPDFYRSELIGRPDGGQIWDGSSACQPTTNLIFYRLFMANNEKTIMAQLSKMDINLNFVSLTRLNGVIAYQIGETDAESPTLLIEKKRFLPLLFCYRITADSGSKMVAVQFDDYRKLREGWYPYKVICSTENEIMESHSIHNLQVNMPIEYPLVRIHEEKRPYIQDVQKEKDPLREENIRELINILKEKYL